MSEQNTLTPETEQAAGNETGNGPVDPAVASGIPGVMASLQAAAAGSPDLERILDIPVQLSVAGAPMDVLINGYLIAQGEVVVVNDRFGIRLTDIVTPAERMRRLNRG